MVARRDRMATRGNGYAFRSREAGIVSQTVWYGISLSSSWLVQRVVCHLFRFTSVSLSLSVSLSYSDQNPQSLLLEHKCRSCSQSQYKRLLHSPSHNSRDSPRGRTRSSRSSSLRDCRSRSRTRCARENHCRTTTGRCLRICVGANDWYQAGSVFGAGICPRAGKCCQGRATGGRGRDDGGG